MCVNGGDGVWDGAFAWVKGGDSHREGGVLDVNDTPISAERMPMRGATPVYIQFIFSQSRHSDISTDRPTNAFLRAPNDPRRHGIQ